MLHILRGHGADPCRPHTCPFSPCEPTRVLLSCFSGSWSPGGLHLLWFLQYFIPIFQGAPQSPREGRRDPVETSNVESFHIMSGCGFIVVSATPFLLRNSNSVMYIFCIFLIYLLMKLRLTCILAVVCSTAHANADISTSCFSSSIYVLRDGMWNLW